MSLSPEDYAGRLAAVLRLARQRSERVRGLVAAELGSEGPEWQLECRDCRGGTRTLHLTETVVATGDGPLALVWNPCPECSIREDLRAAGVPGNLLTASLDNWRVEDPRDASALEKAREFAVGRTGNLILQSPDFGNGKSHLAVAVLREFLKRGVRGRFWKQGEFLQHIRERYEDRTRENVVEVAKRTGLLILDDLGLSVGGRDEVPLLHDVLDHRYGNSKPTILTMNISPSQFSAVVGPRMASRLREALFAWTVIHGPSRRLKNRNAYLQT